eukprot:10539456-Alexandrium_andersonii.AAC.1
MACRSLGWTRQLAPLTTPAAPGPAQGARRLPPEAGPLRAARSPAGLPVGPLAGPGVPLAPL